MICLCFLLLFGFVVLGQILLVGRCFFFFRRLEGEEGDGRWVTVQSRRSGLRETGRGPVFNFWFSQLRAARDSVTAACTVWSMRTRARAAWSQS